MMRDVRSAISCCVLCALCLGNFLVAEEVKSPESWQEKLLGSTLVYADKREVNTTEQLEGKMVALYFSFDGCGFCRKFSPELKKMYKKLQKSGAPFEVVLISLDDSPAKMVTMMDDEDMPWPAMSYHLGRSQKISKKYHAYGAPVLVVLDADGEIISDDGRFAVEREGRLAYYAWRMGVTPISDIFFKFVPTQYDFNNPKSCAFKIAKLAILILAIIYVCKGIKAVFLKIYGFWQERRANKACGNGAG